MKEKREDQINEIKHLREEKYIKKDIFFDILSMNKIRQVCFFIICMILILSSYFFASSGIKDTKEKDLFEECRNGASNTDYDLLYEVESVGVKNGKLELHGWAFDLHSTNREIRVALRNVDESSVILSDVELNARDDIKKYYDSEVDNGDIGFISKIPKRKVKENNCYEILLSLMYDDETVQRFSTGSYLYNGGLYKYNPLEFIEPTVNNVEFNEAINNGVVCSYDMERKMWIYSYNQKLYYIVNYSLIGNYEEMPKFPVYLYTSQVEKVREEGIGRADYNLSLDECINEHNEEYYLLSIPIDVDYPITCIRTGLYQGNEEKAWVWMVTFRP